MLSRVSFFLVVFLFSSFSDAAIAQGEQTVGKPTAYGDWTVQCAEKKGEKKLCVMQQKSFLEKSKQPLMVITIRKSVNKNKDNAMTFSLPLGSYLPAGMQFYFNGSIDKKAHFPFAYCDQSGCHVNLILDKALSKKIETSKDVSVAIMSAKNISKPVQIPVSAKGFQKAFTAL